MISSSRQLKDKVRNISDGNSNKASTLIRNFMIGINSILQQILQNQL